LNTSQTRREQGGESRQFDRERDIALEAVRQAARLCQRVQARRVVPGTLVKGDKSPVTLADFGAQALVARVLATAFPGDALMGEEDAAELRAPKNTALADQVFAEVMESVPGATPTEILGWIDRARSEGGAGRFWSLDPIDGTKGFLRGEQYAVALALLEGGDVKVGALACPNVAFAGQVGCVLLASRGGGAFVAPLAGDSLPVPARASSIEDPAAARLLESVEAGHGDHGLNDRIKAALQVGAPSLRLDSQAKYALLARGDGDVYLRMPSSAEYRENLWDQAAGAIVIEEAGGRVTDMHGAPLDFTTGRQLERNQGILATNGRLHDAFLAAIRSAVAGGGA